MQKTDKNKTKTNQERFLKVLRKQYVIEITCYDAVKVI